jgi:hypothetical protein
MKIDLNNRVFMPDAERLTKEADLQEKAQRKNVLSTLLDNEKKVNDHASKVVVFPECSVSFDKVSVVTPGTVTTIQGKAGSHKSRLAQIFAAIILGRNPIAGFKSPIGAPGAVVGYIDTERSTSTDLPFAVQNIRQAAGLERTKDSVNLFATSLRNVAREDRFLALEEYVNHIEAQKAARGISDWATVVVLDVVTDLGRSFNNDVDALQLYDYLLTIADTTQTAFICVLHENPGSEKARGHVGTEGTNKSNVAIQISADENGLIKVKFLKTRNSARPEPFFLNYNPETRSLEKVDQPTESPSTKAAEIVNDFFVKKATEQADLSDILKYIQLELNCDDRRARYLFNEVLKNPYKSYKLAQTKEGRKQVISFEENPDRKAFNHLKNWAQNQLRKVGTPGNLKNTDQLRESVYKYGEFEAIDLQIVEQVIQQLNL